MATTGANSRGLVPVRRQDGSPPSPANRYPTGSNTATLMLGDPVFLDANRKVQRFTGAIVSANSPACLGVIVGLLNADGRPLTHVTEKQIQVSASAYVLVCDDPDALFEADCTASASFPATYGRFCGPAYGTRVTANGMGGAGVGAPVVTAAGHPFQIYSLAPTELDNVGGANNNFLVRISNHVFRRSTRLQGPIEAADA